MLFIGLMVVTLFIRKLHILSGLVPGHSSFRFLQSMMRRMRKGDQSKLCPESQVPLLGKDITSKHPALVMTLDTNTSSATSTFKSSPNGGRSPVSERIISWISNKFSKESWT